ncbi:MAG: DEAD/DEAH box helicase [Bacteroidales bacterium]|nr:DEAD/DEAH box helicase [Bacteroidales bacterium]
MNLEDFKQKAVLAMGFDHLNMMQEKMLETAVSGKNVLLLSPTGSGKTVAFLLPLLWAKAKTLTIVPSRELAQQIGDVAKRLGLRCVLCYGGHDARIENQRLATLQNAESYLVVGTSGRLKDHIERRHLDPATFTHLVLDEYDKSLELGFEEEIKFITSRLAGRQQTLLTSATHAVPIAPWLNCRPYEQLDFTDSTPKATPASDTPRPDRLQVYQVTSPIADKLETLRELLGALPDQRPVMVFSNYRESAERIAHYLQEQGIECALYHGGLAQDLRDKALIRLRSNTVRVISSTDLGARGLDIPEVAHIVHYHLPADIETWTHRNGRTARQGASGTAYLIVGPNEKMPEWIQGKVPVCNCKRLHSLLQSSAPTSDNADTTEPAARTLVYIGRGKKEKISKGDIVGFFTKNGGITGDQIGRIDVMEHCSYCAIDSSIVHDVLDRVKGLKIKGEKTIYKIVSTN